MSILEPFQDDTSQEAVAGVVITALDQISKQHLEKKETSHKHRPQVISSTLTKEWDMSFKVTVQLWALCLDTPQSSATILVTES